MAAWDQGAEEVEGSPGFLIGSWVSIGDAKSLLPNSPGPCKDRSSGGESHRTQKSTGSDGWQWKAPGVPGVATIAQVCPSSLLLSSLQIVGCEAGQRQTEFVLCG